MQDRLVHRTAFPFGTVYQYKHFSLHACRAGAKYSECINTDIVRVCMRSHTRTDRIFMAFQRYFGVEANSKQHTKRVILYLRMKHSKNIETFTFNTQTSWLFMKAKALLITSMLKKSSPKPKAAPPRSRRISCFEYSFMQKPKKTKKSP